MKINSINNVNTSYSQVKTQSFKHTAVPYPEYENAYVYNGNKQKNLFGLISEKISDLFHPEVTKEAKNIKSQINSIFDDKNSQEKHFSAVA